MASPTRGRGREPTPELLLRTAERLFAIHGIEAVSLRQIGTAAGQRNTGVVQYHFGSKEGVVNALFEHRLAVVNERQLTLYAKVKAEGRLHDPRTLIELITRPLADELDTESWLLGVLTRVRHYPQELVPYRRVPPEVSTGSRRLGRLMAIHLRPLPPRLRAGRRDAVVGAVFAALSDRQLAVRGDIRGLAPTELFLEDLIDAVTAMLTAPTSATTAALLERKRRSASA